MLKILLAGRSLALTVKLLGRTAGGRGLCTEALAMLALGILGSKKASRAALFALDAAKGFTGMVWASLDSWL